jgi:hypothetical protein
MREWRCCVVLLLAFTFCGVSIVNVFQIQFCSTIPTHTTTGDSRRYDSRSLTLHDPPPRKALKHIYLLGERNSGTTLIEQLLVRQLDSEHIKCIPDASSKLEQLFGVCWTLSKNIPVFGSKHIMMHQQRGLNMTEVEFLSQTTDILWILVVRDPCSWADAMYPQKFVIVLEYSSSKRNGRKYSKPINPRKFNLDKYQTPTGMSLHYESIS